MISLLCRPARQLNKGLISSPSNAGAGDRHGRKAAMKFIFRRRDYHLPRRSLIFLRIIPQPGRFPTFFPTSGAGNHRTTTDYDGLTQFVQRRRFLLPTVRDGCLRAIRAGARPLSERLPRLTIHERCSRPATRRSLDKRRSTSAHLAVGVNSPSLSSERVSSRIVLPRRRSYDYLMLLEW